MMSDKFIKAIAERRAEKLFTKEFFRTCTDSWYLDEQFEFEGHEVGVNGRHPSPEESDKYMGYMIKLKDKYQDDFFSTENAVCAYSGIIDRLRDIIESIDEFNTKYKEFECTDGIIKNIKNIGNYFVYKYNELLPIYNKKVKDSK